MRRLHAWPVLSLLSLWRCPPAWSGPTIIAPTRRCLSPTRRLQGWTVAQPQDASDRGPWWSIYHDPELDRLERQVEISNQTVKQFEAEYRNAVALVREARASLFPTVDHHSGRDAQLGTGRRRPSCSSFAARCGGGGGAPRTQYSIEGAIDWTPDVWGKVRRQVESQVAAAQVSAADLANAKLSAQMTLAADYFDLRAEDSLERTAAPDRRRVSASVRYREQPVSRRHQLVGGCGDRAGATGRRARAACRRRRAAGDLRACHRRADRPSARRPDDPACAADLASAGAAAGPAVHVAATPSRYRRGGTADAGGERADRRAGGGVLSGYQPVHARRFRRQPAVAVVHRRPIACGRSVRRPARRCSRAVRAPPRWRRRAPPTIRASPIIARWC